MKPVKNLLHGQNPASFKTSLHGICRWHTTKQSAPNETTTSNLEIHSQCSIEYLRDPFPPEIPCLRAEWNRKKSHAAFKSTILASLPPQQQRRGEVVLHIFSKMFSLSHFNTLFQKFGIDEWEEGKSKKSVFMQSVNYRWDHFCDYLHSDARALLECEEVGSVWRIIMDYSALFCALMILQKNGNHEMKWAARIMPISTVIYKFYRINFLFSFRRRPSCFFIPRFHFPDHAELAIKLSAKLAAMRVNESYYESSWRLTSFRLFPPCFSRNW